MTKGHYRVVRKSVKTRFSTLGGNTANRAARQVPDELMLVLRPGVDGAPLLCAGLPSRFAWRLAHDAVTARLSDDAGQDAAGKAASDVVRLLEEQLAGEFPSVAWTSGVGRLLEHVLHRLDAGTR